MSDLIEQISQDLDLRFTQIHLLTSYPAANLNRDDTGRPKTVIYGGDQRLRISSQCLKRNWRISDTFKQEIENNIGTRTRIFLEKKYKELIKKTNNKRKEINKIDAIFFIKKICIYLTYSEKKLTDKLKSYENDYKKYKDKEAQLKEEDIKKLEEDNLQLDHLIHFTQEELQLINNLIVKKTDDHTFEPNKEDLKLFCKNNINVDIALWGRMLASYPDMNIEAACQVAHAFSVNAVTIEDDYFTALDDLNDGSEDAGAAMVNDTGFGSGLFYSYICVNNELLLKNLGGNKELAEKTIRALIKAITTVTPSGKQNSFATRAYACYGLVEVGNQQPRSLAMAYLKSISGKDGNIAEQAIKELEQQRDNFDNVYGKCAKASFNAVTGTGKLEDVINKAAGVFA